MAAIQSQTPVPSMENARRDPLFVFPSEIVEDIVKYLPAREIFMLRMVSKLWNQLCTSQWLTRQALDSYNIEDIYRQTDEEVFVLANHHMGKPAQVSHVQTIAQKATFKDIRIYGSEAACLYDRDGATCLSVVELSDGDKFGYVTPWSGRACFLSDKVVGILYDYGIIYNAKSWQTDLDISDRLSLDHLRFERVRIPAFVAEAYDTMIVGLFENDGTLGIWLFNTITKGVDVISTTITANPLSCSLHAGNVITIMWPSVRDLTVHQYKYCGVLVFRRRIPWEISCWNSYWNDIDWSCVKTVIRDAGKNQYSLSMETQEASVHVLVDLSANTAVTYVEKPICFYKDWIYIAGDGCISSVRDGRQSVWSTTDEDLAMHLVMNDGYLVEVVADVHENVSLNVFCFCQKVEYKHEINGARKPDVWTWREVGEQEKMVNLVNEWIKTYTEICPPSQLAYDGVPDRMMQVWKDLSVVVTREEVDEVIQKHKEVLNVVFVVCQSVRRKSTATLAMEDLMNMLN